MPWDIYIEPALATTYFRRCQEFGLQQSTELVCRRRGMQLALTCNEPDYLTRNPTSQHGSGYTFTWCRPTVEPVWSRTIWDDLSETHIGCLSLVIRWSRHVWLPSNKPMFLSRTRPLGNARSPLPAGTYGRYYSVARTSGVAHCAASRSVKQTRHLPAPICNRAQWRHMGGNQLGVTQTGGSVVSFIRCEATGVGT